MSQKIIRTTLVSAIFRQFGICFALLILQDKHSRSTLTSKHVRKACQSPTFLPVSKAHTNTFYIF
jgi:hypothetical protein